MVGCAPNNYYLKYYKKVLKFEKFKWDRNALASAEMEKVKCNTKNIETWFKTINKCKIN